MWGVNNFFPVSQKLLSIFRKRLALCLQLGVGTLLIVPIIAAIYPQIHKFGPLHHAKPKAVEDATGIL
jgi:hypothetical protein